MCQNRTDSQTPLSGAWAKVQGQATAQLQLSNQSPVICQFGTWANSPLALRRSKAQSNPNQSPRFHGGSVTIEPVGEFTLKDIRRPLAAYNVLAAVSA
jgi:hypothetical protein